MTCLSRGHWLSSKSRSVAVFAVFGCVAGSTGPEGPGSPSEPEVGLKADLFTGPIEVPDHIRVDSILEMTIGVRNGGTGLASAGWIVRVMLSTDALIDSADIQVDHFAAPRELAAGAEDRYLRHKKLRAKTPLGTYYIGSILDVTRRVSEVSESNNAQQSPATIILTAKTADVPGGNQSRVKP